ncbi:MAG TPA: hypothetical protein VHE10_01075 [Candidatus Paceibacterota bacterium]|nr:hypothetical protein [Candidatus Paceibacterota bacterium]
MDTLNQPIVQKLFSLVVDPLIQLIFAAAVVYFLWGVFKYIQAADDPDERIQGGKHIIWSVIGLFIMISVWGIIAVIKRTIGV